MSYSPFIPSEEYLRNFIKVLTWNFFLSKKAGEVHYKVDLLFEVQDQDTKLEYLGALLLFVLRSQRLIAVFRHQSCLQSEL